MSRKLAVFVATLGVVSASVIVESNDEPVAQLTEPFSGCKPRACDHLCRWLGLPGGSCVNGRCKCKEKEAEDLEVKPEVIEPKSVGSCNYECDQSCRRIGYTGGACVNGRCKCDINVQEAVEVESETTEPQSVRRCNYRECDQSCRRIGFTCSACINSRCKCDINAQGAVGVEPEVIDPQSVRSCNYRECDQSCRRIGFTGGAYVSGHCKCDINAQGAVEDIAEDEFESLLPQSVRNCNYRECDQRCRRLDFTGGACVNGRCKCDNFLTTEYNERDLTEGQTEFAMAQSVRSCNYRECGQRCRRLGFRDGACVNGRCKCDNFLSAEQSIDDNLHKTPEFQSTGNCYRRQCTYSCRKRGHKTGICIDGQCKCQNYGNVEIYPQVEPETPEVQSTGNCYRRQCTYSCRKKGYETGVCIDGQCECHNYGDAENYPQGEPETPELQSTSNCYRRQCTYRCRKQGHKTGICIDGQCKCWNYGTAENYPQEPEDMFSEMFRICLKRGCDLRCRRLGYTGGACSDDRCKCKVARTTDKSVEEKITTFTPSFDDADNEIE